jgi:hypothetical protein
MCIAVQIRFNGNKKRKGTKLYQAIKRCSEMFHNISLRLKIQNTTDEELYDTTFLLSIRVNP